MKWYESRPHTIRYAIATHPPNKKYALKEGHRYEALYKIVAYIENLPQVGMVSVKLENIYCNSCGERPCSSCYSDPVPYDEVEVANECR